MGPLSCFFPWNQRKNSIQTQVEQGRETAEHLLPMGDWFICTSAPLWLARDLASQASGPANQVSGPAWQASGLANRPQSRAQPARPWAQPARPWPSQPGLEPSQPGPRPNQPGLRPASQALVPTSHASGPTSKAQPACPGPFNQVWKPMMNNLALKV